MCNEIFFYETSHDDNYIRFNKVFKLRFNSQYLTQILLYSSLLIKNLSEEELAVSASTIFKIALFWSACFLTVLWLNLNENYYPFLHVIFIFLWNLTGMKKGISYIKFYMFWKDICFFLNKLAKMKTILVNI